MKNPTPLRCIYFESRRCEGYFTVPESNEHSFRAPGATIDLSIETIRCAADGNLTGALFFPRFRYITTKGSIQRRLLETLAFYYAREIYVCVPYLHTCFWFQLWSPRNFRAETFALIPRDCYVNHSKLHGLKI